MSHVAEATIAKLEAGQRRSYDRDLNVTRHALEAAGVEALPVKGGGTTVRLPKVQS